MIAGIGIDLVSIPDLKKKLENAAFRRKVFTPEEQANCDGVKNAAERYAGKFAAKEALMKAIGKGIRQGVWFTQITVLNQETGAPYIEVTGKAKETLTAMENAKIHVSISHTSELATAVVILETRT